MKKATSSLDEKGRLLVPQSLRDALSIKSGDKLVLELDEAQKKISIEPAYEKKLLRMSIHLGDQPGSLAHAADALAKAGVDLVRTESHSSRRGEAALWIVECSPGKASVSEIRAALGKAGAKVNSAEWE
ncbi:Transcriptional regulator MraZ [uncultured archaeon]|nr:Transcriptional regulator MraZ [uncultured archaeon]